MIRISRREFQLYPYKYIGVGEFILTRRGKDDLKVTMEQADQPLELEAEDVG